MRQYEDGRVIGGLVTPPTFPGVVGPRSPHGTEHVTPENPGADPGEPLRRHIVVDARFAIFIAVHPLPGARVEEPVKQRRPADSERILKILTRPGTVSVD
jgi:hypothetical protein